MNKHTIQWDRPSNSYRTLVALDDEFASGPPAGEDELPHLLQQAIQYFEGEGTHSKRRGTLPPRTALDDVPGLLRRLRALLTVRPPAPLPPHVHAWLDALLQHQRRASGDVDAGDLAAVSEAVPQTWFRPSEAVAIWQGDITRLAADAIVNAANAELLGCFRPFHPCIDNAIHWAAGPRLREDCGRIMTAQGHTEVTGGAKITRGYNLPARFVLHTVGPIVQGSLTDVHRRHLGQCYRACLDVAADVGGIQTLAFCAISTGVFGFPKRAAASIAVQAVAAWMNERPRHFSKVIFNVFSDEDEAAYVGAFSGRTVHDS